MKWAIHGLIILGLTILTQIGGLIWLASRFSRWPRTTFLIGYCAITLTLQLAGTGLGRTALPCFATKETPLQSTSALYCALNRNYASQKAATGTILAAREVAKAFPGTITLYLDAGFPIGLGFPMLPHLSHGDGERVDFAFYYRDGKDGYLPGRTRSPIGYWAFQQPSQHSPQPCSGRNGILRWDMEMLQPLWRDWSVDRARTRLLINQLLQGRARRVLLEPHLKHQLNLTSSKIRFQGCSAARHDDHLHADF